MLSPSAIIPITAFVLGTWQVQRLKWKTDLIAKSEDRLVREPLPLPPRIDPEAAADFDYRRVYAVGRLRHDQEMLVGPRVRDGESGYMVVTPLEREGGAEAGTTVLVNRGWISKAKADQRTRHPDSLPRGEVRVDGMLRKPWKKNTFTPANRPDKREFYFPDVQEMAALTGSQPVWVEQTMGEYLAFFPWRSSVGMNPRIKFEQRRRCVHVWISGVLLTLRLALEPDFFQVQDFQAKGIPIGKPAEVTLRNNHAQYIFTW